jgi:predicted dienelactone hydrolase
MKILYEVLMPFNLITRRQVLAAITLSALNPFGMAQIKKNMIRESDTQIHVYDGNILDPKTQRELSIRIRLPQVKSKSPLIIYSPGLGSGLSNGQSWCDAWVKAGNVVVTISHPVTNDVIWDNEKISFTNRLQQSLAGPQYDLRVSDCKFVITELLKGSQSSLLQKGGLIKGDLKLEDAIDPKRIGIAGHSYGALTVQSICGQGGVNLIDHRVKAAIAFSPGSMTESSAKKMANVKIPFFCIMGDQDNQVTFKKGLEKMTLGMPLAKRKWVFDNLPRGARQLWIVSPADHMTFAGEKVDEQSFSRDIPIGLDGESNTWERIDQMTTLFWDYHLSNQAKTEGQKSTIVEYEKTVKAFLHPKEFFEIS